MTRTLACLLLAFASSAAPVSAQGPAPDTGRGVIVIEALVAPAPAPAPSAPAAPPLMAYAPPVVAPVPAVAPLSVTAQYGVPASFAPTDVAQAEAPRSRPSWRTIGTGIGLFLGGYVINIAGSALWSLTTIFTGQRSDFFLWSLVPIAGPIAQLTMADQDWMMPILAVDLLIQVAGLVTAIAGTAVRQSSLRATASGPSISFAPVASREVVGLTAVGTF